MRAGHTAHVDQQAALELARQTRPPPTSQGAAFALATGSAQATAGNDLAGAARAETNGAAAPAQSASTRSSGAALPSDRATASTTGSLLNQLQQLSQSDPSSFQKAATAIANQLQSQADAAGGANAQALAPMIDSFRAAAQSGAAPTPGKLQPAGTASTTHPSVQKYAQENSAASGNFSLEALQGAMRDALGAAAPS